AVCANEIGNKAQRNSKGRFVKSGGRKTTKRRSRGTTAIVVRDTVSVASRPRRAVPRPAAHHKGKKRGHRRGHHHGGVTIAKLLATGVVLGSAAETNTGPAGDRVYNLVQKLPGVKTFGGAVTAGLYAGAIGKYTRLGRGRFGGWLRAAGVIGVVGAALKIGAQGTKFQWLGEESQPYGDFRVG